MSILKNFDLDSIRKARARNAARSGMDLVTALAAISPDIANLKVGETAKVDKPEGMGLRKAVMQITAKVNNLVPQGGEWEGRQFDIVSDGDSTIYVQRGPDLKGKDIPVRARRGGGRKPATATANADA
jgi:hypothetical protein